jgi:hypothetical protein
MYTFKSYLQNKVSNSYIERFENLCNALEAWLGMPTVILGLHTAIKHRVSGKEQDIKQVTPRCVLNWQGISIDRGAMTSVQSSAPFTSADSDGNVDRHILEYRRMPSEASFNMQIVLDNADMAIRCTEYLAVLAMMIPLCDGDEHCKSTVIIGESASIDNEENSNDILVSTSLKLNMQVLEPLTLATTDSQVPMNGVGVLMPDGTWNLTPKGELIKDANGQPILDSNGNMQYGTYVEPGWYRLRKQFLVHGHTSIEPCLSSESDPEQLVIQAGSE